MAVFLHERLQNWLATQPAKDTMSAYLYLALIVLASFTVHSFLRKQAQLALVNGAKFPWERNKSKKRFILDAAGVLMQGFSTAAEKPFRVLAEVGEIIILPPKYAYEIRNDERLSFTKAAFKVLM